MKASHLDRVLAARAARRPVALITRLPDGAQAVMDDGGLDGDLDLSAEERAAVAAMVGRDETGVVGSLFVRCYAPALRLLVVGAVHIAQVLAPMAALAGFAVTVIDPRQAFVTAARFPGIALTVAWPEDALAREPPDRHTAVVTLTHDPKLDDPALVGALRSPAFYIGALGSGRTQARRLERLRALGFSAADVARIHGPVGLPLGGRSAAEIAVATLAEIVKERHAVAAP